MIPMQQGRNGKWRLMVRLPDGDRFEIRIDSGHNIVPPERAEEFRRHVQAVMDAKRDGALPPPETIEWLVRNFPFLSFRK